MSMTPSKPWGCGSRQTFKARGDILPDVSFRGGGEPIIMQTSLPPSRELDNPLGHPPAPLADEGQALGGAR
jgi:hypothetical protein